MIKPAQLILGVVALLFAGYIGASARSQGSGNQTPVPAAEASTSVDGWEYLVVSGVTTNLSDSGNDYLRKSERYQVGREQFVVEKNLDKLGRDGWELVTVQGPPNDPVYYFKRRK